MKVRHKMPSVFLKGLGMVLKVSNRASTTEIWKNGLFGCFGVLIWLVSVFY